MPWHNLGRSLAAGRRRRVQARLFLARSYRRLFSGRGSRSDAETVLADLANHSGFYRVTEPGGAEGALDFAEGKRAVYGRVFRFLRMSAEEAAALEEAARAEALSDTREGEI